MDYIEEFELVTGPLCGIDGDIIKGMFLNGLKEELRAELKVFELETLFELRECVLLLEERNMMWKRSGVSRESEGVAILEEILSLRV